MGDGGKQRKRSITVDGDEKDRKLAEFVDPSDIRKMMSERSRKRSSSITQTTDPKFRGPLRFAEPVRPQDINSGNLSLTEGCDTYVTPDCIRRKCYEYTVTSNFDIMIRTVRDS